MKKGDRAVMLFHGGSFTSKEEHEVLRVHKNGTVTFDMKTGKCLNDIVDFGCYRTLKIR